jgi:hypothetical protein
MLKNTDFLVKNITNQQVVADEKSTFQPAQGKNELSFEMLISLQ